MTLRKIHIWLSITITAIFLCIGAFWCTRSYVRLWETITELGSSIKFYFCEIFEIENTTKVEVIEPSDILINGVMPIPSTASTFWLKFRVYFTLLVNGVNLGSYFTGIGLKIGDFTRILVLLLPIVILAVILVRKIYNTPNTNHNRDTRPLRLFKKISGVTYQPIKRFVLGYRCFLDNNPKWKTAWLWIWLGNVNFLSIIVAFISYYFYFSVSFNLASIYPQIVDLLKDLLLVIRHFPWFVTGTIVWIIFCKIRESRALNVLERNEARNCGFINALPIVTMTCGSMGKKKTTMTTDMALSQTVMFRQEAFHRLQKQDMKFPFFPWICFENEIKKCMEHGRIYNLASIRTWVAQKRDRYYKHLNAGWQLYGYDIERYGMWYDSGLTNENIFDVLETYAKLYFIYVIESSLLVANYSIRAEDILYDSGNFPMRSYSFFRPSEEYTRFAHILDFDVLRLGKKVIENNPKAGSFEFGVVVITEVGKERANNLELKELKKGAEETNQKNDLFNAWLKMCRHSATVDNFPFIKVFTDEQRPESWGADARDLADIVTIVKSGQQKLALPFFTIEEMLYEKTFNWFLSVYYNFRHIRGDNTLLVHCLKAVISKIFWHCEKIYNRFGFSVLSVDKERGTQDEKPERKLYYLANYKIYRERFSTDCFSDYFNDLAEKSGVGLLDYIQYASVKASVDELKSQNSYFIRDLYGN